MLPTKPVSKKKKKSKRKNIDEALLIQQHLAASMPNFVPGANLPYVPVCSVDLWNLSSKPSKDLQAIQKLHIYEFDNALFNFPSPNPDLFSQASINILINSMAWWSNMDVLNEVKNKSGIWNDHIIELIKESYNQSDTLCVLVAVRRQSVQNFVFSLVEEKQLEFDDIITSNNLISPTGDAMNLSTGQYKIQLLHDLLMNCPNCNELEIYHASNPKQTEDLYKYLQQYHDGKISYQVNEVYKLPRYLDPLREYEIVMDNISKYNVDKNNKLKKFIFKTELVTSNPGLLIGPDDTVNILNKLDTYLPKNNSGIITDTYKFQADKISPIPFKGNKSLSDSLPQTLQLPNTLEWTITHVGWTENVWTAKVKCLDYDCDQQFKDESYKFPVRFLIILCTTKSIGQIYSEIDKIKEWIEIEEMIVKSTSKQQNELKLYLTPSSV